MMVEAHSHEYKHVTWFVDCFMYNVIRPLYTLRLTVYIYTVEPPITDPPTSGQPLYNGH